MHESGPKSPNHDPDEPPVELMHASSSEGKIGEPGDDFLKRTLEELEDEADAAWVRGVEESAVDAPAITEPSTGAEGFTRVAEDASPAELADVLRRYHEQENDPSLRNGGKPRILPLGLAAIRLSKDLKVMTTQQQAVALAEYQRQQELDRAGVSDSPVLRERDWAERAANDDTLKD